MDRIRPIFVIFVTPTTANNIYVYQTHAFIAVESYKITTMTFERKKGENQRHEKLSSKSK